MVKISGIVAVLATVAVTMLSADQAMAQSQQSPIQQGPIQQPTPSPSTVAPTKVPVPTTTAPAPSQTQRPSTTPAPSKTSTPTPTPTPSQTQAPTPVPTPSGPTLPHWVGVGKPIDNACYRKTYRTKNCPAGYNSDNIATCWAQCPMEYPVECGMECLPQNQDCTKAVLRKVNAVATVALNAASSGVFGQISAASKGVQIGIKCGQQLFSVVNKVTGYVNELEKNGPDTTKEQLLFLLGKSDFAVKDLPIAVTTCLGLPAPTGLASADKVVNIVKGLLTKVLDSKSKGVDLSHPENFLKFASDAGVGSSLGDLSPADKDKLKQLIGAGEICGAKVKTVIDKVVAAIQDLKKNKPDSPVDIIRVAIMNSQLLLKELPDAVTGCFKENAPDGFKNRDQIVKTVHEIIDRVIGASENNGKPLSTAEYALTITNMGLDVLSTFDPTGLANLAKEFIEPICGPTIFIGDIDDGPADKALGLNTIEKAFRGSSGTWQKQGDGQARLTIRSVDDKDVTLNILSGGQVVDHVKIGKGKTVVWTKPLSALQGKTMYLDRWRPGFLGFAGTGGGSLLTWVPNDNDGHLELDVQINPTSFKDHALRALRALGLAH